MTVSLVTGAGGFVGSHLCPRLEAAGMAVRRVSSRLTRATAGPEVGLLCTDENTIARSLEGVDVVYHLAAVAHEALAVSQPEMLQTVNVTVPLRWLRAADRAGVKRFVWLSSIKVLGDVSERPLLPDDPYRPGNRYAASKVAAERHLLEQPLVSTALAVVRPPLVYGAGVKGNFRTLLRWAAGGWPLPLAGATAPRSLVGVNNLCALLLHLRDAGSGVLHVADPDDVSVSRLLGEVRACLAMGPRQFRLPAALLQRVARSIGRQEAYERLFLPLQVDGTGTRQTTGWTPPRTRDEELTETVTWFRTQR